MSSRSKYEYMNKQQIPACKKYAEKRAELRKKSRDLNLDFKDRFIAAQALSSLPRKSSPTRIINRCSATKRTRGFIGLTGTKRYVLSQLADQGLLPAIRRVSW